MATTTITKQEDKTEEPCKIVDFTTELENKAHKGAKAFLVRRGFDILAEDWTCGKDKADFVAMDDDVLCIITVTVEINEGNGLTPENYDRKAFERLAMGYLVENPETEESLVRGDLINMMIIGEHKAFLRYHRAITTEMR